MFLGKIPILAPLSMCLGQDQIIRILVNRDKTQAIIPIDQNLNVGNSVTITALDNKIDKISDIAMNQYNELYVIYSLSSKIGKVDASGKLINIFLGFYKIKVNRWFLLNSRLLLKPF
jgi:hypothetical protein